MAANTAADKFVYLLHSCYLLLELRVALTSTQSQRARTLMNYDIYLLLLTALIFR